MTTTIAGLLSQKPEDIEKGISLLIGCYYSHVPELGERFDNIDPYLTDTFMRISSHVFYRQAMDARREWILFGVKFDDKWVMLCSNAGRELDDYSRRQIVDPDVYVDMIAYMWQEVARLKPRPAEHLKDVVPLETPVQFKFYNEDVRYSIDRY